MNQPPFVWVFALAVLGCGGNVVFVDDGGEGGAGATSTTVGPGPGPGPGPAVGSSTATGTDCATLEQSYLTLFGEATACNVCVDFDPCGSGVEISDSCGCPAGTSDATLAAQAQDAYDAWVAAGCGPYPCGTPCFGPGATWFCAGTGRDCNGQCAVGLL